VSGYVRSIEFQGEFEGEPVTCNLKPLSFADLIRLQEMVSGDEEAAMRIAAVVPSYVENFVGPKAADGSEVSIQEVCSVSYFTELVLDIGRRLLNAALPPQKPSLPSGS
jgi:hypothetical protein